MGDGDQSRNMRGVGESKIAKSESWKGKNEAGGKVPAEIPAERVCDPYTFFIHDLMLMTFDAGTKPGGSRSRWRVHSPSPSRRQLGAHQEREREVQCAELRLLSMELGTAVSTTHQGLISWEGSRQTMI